MVELPYDPPVTLLGIYQRVRRIYVPAKVYTGMLKALFTIAKM